MALGCWLWWRWATPKARSRWDVEAAAKCLDDASLQYWLTHAYFDEERFAEALSAIDQAIALEGERPSYLCIRADVLLGLERFEEAIRDAQAVLDAEPDHWHSFHQMLNAAVAMDRPKDGEAYARELVRLAPTEPEALLAASEFHRSQDRLDQALELVDKALDIDIGEPTGTPSARPRSLRHGGLPPSERRAAAGRFPAAEFRIGPLPAVRLVASFRRVGGGHRRRGTPHRNRPPRTPTRILCVDGALIELGRPADAVAVLDRAPAHRRLPLVAVRRLTGPRQFATTRRPAGTSTGSPNCSPTVGNSGSNARVSTSTRALSTRRPRVPPG